LVLQSYHARSIYFRSQSRREMFSLRLCLACLAFTTIVADVTTDSKQPTDSAHDAAPPEEAPSAIEVAADGSKVDLAKMSAIPEHSEGEITTEIFVQPSGAIIVQNLAATPEMPQPRKTRAGTKARRVANDREQDRVAAGLHHADGVSASVLREEPSMLAGEVEVSTTATPVLRTEATQTKPAKVEAAKSVYMSRSHRIPTSRPPPQQAATTTTTAAALQIDDPEPLGWKHGLIPGILAYLEAEEDTIIRVSVAVFLAIVAFGICACRSITKKAEHPEAAISEAGNSRASKSGASRKERMQKILEEKVLEAAN